MSEEDFLKLSTDNEIREMTEFLMRSNADLHSILKEPIFSFSNIESSAVERHYFEIVQELIDNERERQVSDFKDYVFAIIKKEKPTSEEEVLYLIDGYVRKMPLLFQISTEDLLNLWDMYYKEPETGIELKFNEWASLFRKSYE